jgi:regulator of protease activity HflC (stomatin/prohibitin superfamily)
MAHRLQVIARAARRFVSRVFRPSLAVHETVVSGEAAETPFSAERMYAQLARAQRAVLWIAPVAFAAWLLYAHWPVQSVARGEVGVRTNQLTGTITQWREGSVLVLPGLHDMRVYSLRDQVYRAAQVSSASGPAPLQSIEGLSVGVDLAVRYALDGTRIATVSKNLPDNYGAEIVEPAVQGVIYKVFARYTVREIFSSKRAEIQQTIESELKSRLAADGIVLRGVQMGKVDLPADYRRGMEGLLAEELESQKMQYTLELKEKQVRQGELEANAEKVRREVRAEAAAREQVIAAKAQEEAMKHVLPFKQQQIEQRKLEAEADKQTRVKAAEATAQARRIEAGGEADARQKLAEAEAWRLERIGKVSTDQMAREGALVTQHPLLIQKAMADKLSDKIQVIIAPPPTDGSFVGGTLLGGAGKSGAMAQR